MLPLTRTHHIAIVLIAFVLWSLLSWFWYVCGIKNLCTVGNTSVEVAQVLAPIFPAEHAAAAETACPPYITKDIAKGVRNDPVEVRKLERLLNVLFAEALATDGLYGRNDIAAVKRYEARRFNQVVTGDVRGATRDAINADVCENSPLLIIQP